jgi:CheY-like chemotaxis protein
MIPQEVARPVEPQARILVVDDEPTVRQLVVRILSEAGYTVTAVADGWDGVSAAAAGLPYDLVVTNSFLPNLTGEQLVGYLRRLYPTQPILHLDDLARPIGREPTDSTSRPQSFRVAALLTAVDGVLRGGGDLPAEPPDLSYCGRQITAFVHPSDASL